MSDNNLAYQIEVACGATIEATSATVLLGGMTSIDPPGPSRGSIETTDFDTPAGAKAFIGEAFFDPGELSMTIKTAPGLATEVLLATLMVEQENRLWEIRYKRLEGAPKQSFRGHLTGYTPGTPLGELISYDLKIKVSGAITGAV